MEKIFNTNTSKTQKNWIIFGKLASLLTEYVKEPEFKPTASDFTSVLSIV